MVKNYKWCLNSSCSTKNGDLKQMQRWLCSCSILAIRTLCDIVIYCHSAFFCLPWSHPNKFLPLLVICHRLWCKHWKILQCLKCFSCNLTTKSQFIVLIALLCICFMPAVSYSTGILSPLWFFNVKIIL